MFSVKLVASKWNEDGCTNEPNFKIVLLTITSNTETAYDIQPSNRSPKNKPNSNLKKLSIAKSAAVKADKPIYPVNPVKIMKIQNKANLDRAIMKKQN
jgi:hypothetical protein